MRVAAGLAVFLLLSASSAIAQTNPAWGGSTLLRPGAADTICTTTLLPDNGKNQKKGDVATVCTTSPLPACPIDMHVRHGVGGAMVAVDENGVKRQVIAPRLRLFLDDKRPGKSGQRIVSATVTVHGSSGKARILPLDSPSGGNRQLESSDVQRTVSVNLAQWGEPGVSGDFRVPGFTSTSRVDLLSLAYADGSTWNLSGPDACRVVPDPLMRIGN